MPSVMISTTKDGKPVMEKATKFWYENNAPRYHAFEFDPTQPCEWMNDKGQYLFNKYQPAHDADPIAGDVSPFITLLAANYPDAGDQDVILGALAFSAQRCGELLKWAPVLQGTHGCGKGWLIEPARYNAGMHNTAMPTPKNLTEDKNGWLGQGTVVFVDEIGEHRKATIAEIADTLKVPVAGDWIGVRAMQKDLQTMRNYACWFIATNFMDSMLMNDPRERRWAPLISALQTAADIETALPVTLWEHLPDVLEGAKQDAGYDADDFFGVYRYWWDHGGAEAIRAYLLQYPPARAGRAPMTTTRNEAVAAGEDDMVRLVREAVAAGDYGFRNGFISSVAVKALLDDEGVKSPNPKYFGANMTKAGFRLSIRSKKTIGDEVAFEADRSVKVKYYYTDATLGDRFHPTQIASLYDQAQRI